MKINEEIRSVARLGTTEERQFNIKGSAKAFKILSDGLYSDKVLAVIRELSCNAKDSHIDSGRGDVPFEIHLPNTLEPWFAVTDNGLGLATENVLNMYSTYFESTKTDSNNVTGCLGLGSKSPFAYTDSFTVESRWEGKLTLFSCFYNESGIPAITIMGEPMDTDEHNGLTVKMAVKEQDMREFANKAANALRRFNPAPIVTGNTSYAITPVTYSVEGTKWKMIDGDNPYGESKINAIQGNVTYPVSKNALGDLTDTQNAIMNLSIDLFFEIGELDVAANREALGYDIATIANIKARLDIIGNEIAPLFQDKFTNCKTLWEARLLFKEVINPLSQGLQRILSDSNVGLKWHKQPLSGVFKLDINEFPDSIVQFIRGTRGNRGEFITSAYDNIIKFDVSSEVLFFYDDVGHGSHSRMTHFLETNADAKRRQYLIKTDSKKALKVFSKALGNVTIQPVSNLAVRPKAERAAARVTSKVLAYTGRANDRRNSWNPTDLDMQTGGIYVMINRFKVYDVRPSTTNGCTDYENEIDGFDSIVESAKANKIVDLTDKIIYGIRKGDVSKLKDGSGWVNLFDLIRDKLAVAIKKERVSQVIADRYAYANFSCNIVNFIGAVDRSTVVKNSPLALFLTAYDYLKGRDSSRAQAISNVADNMHFKIDSSISRYDLDKLWEAVVTQYPLIGMLSDRELQGGYYSESKAKDKNYTALNEYIAMIESKSKVAVLKTAA